MSVENILLVLLKCNIMGTGFSRCLIFAFPLTHEILPFYRDLFLRMGKFPNFSHLTVFVKEKTFWKKAKVFNGNVVATFAIKGGGAFTRRLGNYL